MEAKETDVNFPQSSDQVEAKVDGIAGGIMDLLDNPDPNSSGEAEAKKAEPETGTTEPETGTEESEEPTKYTIKWQGQEKEVTQDELLDLAQKGFDYTKKTQTLAEERDQLSPYIGLANKIKNDPFLANQIAALMSGQTPQPKVEPKFDDPIDQLKHEMKQETIAELRKEMAQNMVPLQRQQALNQVKMQVQSDPDYKTVHSQIIEMVKSQPPALQKTMYLQLDQDPTAYLEVFQHYKNNLSKPSKPEPVKKETKAPILESGGVSAPSVIVSKEKQERISKQKAKAMRSGDNTEIAAWLQSSGALEHLY
jgi:hypothetical protein